MLFTLLSLNYDMSGYKCNLPVCLFVCLFGFVLFFVFCFALFVFLFFSFYFLLIHIPFITLVYIMKYVSSLYNEDESYHKEEVDIRGTNIHDITRNYLQNGSDCIFTCIFQFCKK